MQAAYGKKVIEYDRNVVALSEVIDYYCSNDFLIVTRRILGQSYRTLIDLFSEIFFSI